MEKKTFVPERKAYLAPATKSYFLDLEENIMSVEDTGEEVSEQENWTGSSAWN